MHELKLPPKFKNILGSFTRDLKNVYQDELIAVILYGSAASGEFIGRHSNLNVLVVLKDTDLESFKNSSGIINRFPRISPLFLTEEYIASSIDIFPIEFLDLQENYFVLYGKDVLKEIRVDTRNLRFQCEQELKLKLLNLRQIYLKIYRNKAALRNLLVKSFTSILHILRNILRLRNRKPPYLKEDILKVAAVELSLDISVWEKILAAKQGRIKLRGSEVEKIFAGFLKELEKIVELVDKL